MFEELNALIKELYQKQSVALHEPVFRGHELEYVTQCIQSTFVSTVGEFVPKFEKSLCDFTGAKYAIATTNGTSALHLSLVALGVEHGDEVITQNITFIATVNAISYCGATPVIIDADRDNLALSPTKLKKFLEENAQLKDRQCVNKKTGRTIKACMPMHVFGHPAKLNELKSICTEWNLSLIEDAAESLGSYCQGRHTGTIGKVGTLSFNGNKVVTCGGGGAVLTDDPVLGQRLKHLSTTAKVGHRWEFFHDAVGYNYRLPNLNAALGLAQMEKLPMFLESKRKLAGVYRKFANDKELHFLDETDGCISNFWLNAFIFKDKLERDEFLQKTNDSGIMTRPLWTLISDLPIYKHSVFGDVENSEFFRDRLVNIPSGVLP